MGIILISQRTDKVIEIYSIERDAFGESVEFCVRTEGYSFNISGNFLPVWGVYLTAIVTPIDIVSLLSLCLFVFVAFL